jgi:uncharacterized protein YecE (DUF72 family)
MALLIGTSGWTYPHWQEAFFPASLRSPDRLRFYAKKFNSVEVNTTFYGTPKKPTVRSWVEAVPRSFRFAIKASRYTTHNKKLLQPRKSTVKLFRALEPIEAQTTAMLFQLPPFFKVNAARLKDFLKKMPSGYCYAFEFRHPTWFCQEVYDLLHAANAALCIWELKGERSPTVHTSNFVYVRLHGPQAAAYRGSYPDEALRKWADEIATWRKKRHDVLFYFDNDEKGYAPMNAARLMELTSPKSSSKRAARSSR